MNMTSELYPALMTIYVGAVIALVVLGREALTRMLRAWYVWKLGRIEARISASERHSNTSDQPAAEIQPEAPRWNTSAPFASRRHAHAPACEHLPAARFTAGKPSISPVAMVVLTSARNRGCPRRCLPRV